MVLAGGRSRRLGLVDKTSALFRPEPAGPGRGPAPPRLRRALFAIGRDLAHAGRGPLAAGDAAAGPRPHGGGITALEAFQAPTGSVISCDLPYLDEDTLLALWRPDEKKSLILVMTTFQAVETGYRIPNGDIRAPRRCPT